MRLSTDQRGQTTIVIALGIFTLCGMAGLAADVGTLFRVKRILQTAADAGAIAAAAEARYGNDNAAAIAIATLNGVTNGSNGYTVTESITAAGYKVVASKSAPTFFMKVFGLNSMSVSATAVANNGPASNCIYALDPSGIDVGLTGTADLNMPDCGIIINSASSNGLNMTGTSTLTASSIGIVGGYNTSNNANYTPVPVTGVAPAPNPLAYLSAPSFSTSSCLSDPHITGSSGGSIGPSVSGGTVCYNGLSISGSGAVSMAPGTYIINGAMSMSGSGSLNMTGGTASGGVTPGVTIYLAPPNGSLSLTGSGALNISAPIDPSNPYTGILFFEDPTDTNNMKITGSTGSKLQGIFYAPNAALTLTGSSGATIQADLVVHALSMSGTADFTNYSTANANEPLTSPRLVQ
jgi:Flp pilus assembly protein TadG